MNSLDGFVTLVRDELGLEVTRDSVGADLRDIPGWDSVHLLALLVILERETSRQLSMPDVLEAGSLEHIYELATQP
jgi:acyl carrier protein